MTATDLLYGGTRSWTPTPPTEPEQRSNPAVQGSTPLPTSATITRRADHGHHGWCQADEDGELRTASAVCSGCADRFDERDGHPITDSMADAVGLRCVVCSRWLTPAAVHDGFVSRTHSPRNGGGAW